MKTPLVKYIYHLQRVKIKPYYGFIYFMLHFGYKLQLTFNLESNLRTKILHSKMVYIESQSRSHIIPCSIPQGINVTHTHYNLPLLTTIVFFFFCTTTCCCHEDSVNFSNNLSRTLKTVHLIGSLNYCPTVQLITIKKKSFLHRPINIGYS